MVYSTSAHLIEVPQSLVQVSHHPSRGLAGDLDGGLQDALGDDVTVPGACWLS